MIDFAPFLKWLKYQRVKRVRKNGQRMLLDLNALTVTIHGRYMLTQVIQDPDNGLPDEIRHMYWILLKEAPIKQWAQWN